MFLFVSRSKIIAGGHQLQVGHGRLSGNINNIYSFSGHPVFSQTIFLVSCQVEAHNPTFVLCGVNILISRIAAPIVVWFFLGLQFRKLTSNAICVVAQFYNCLNPIFIVLAAPQNNKIAKTGKIHLVWS